MKKVYLLVIVFIVIGFRVNAQPRNMEKSPVKRLKVEKISFLATALELTPDEAQNFWPVYNEFEKRKLNIEIERRKIDRKIRTELKELDDSEVAKISEQVVDLAIDEAKLKKEYNTKFLKVLPGKKVLRLYHAEKNFRAHMLKEFRRRQMNDLRKDNS